jgi:hypothetical protein
MNKRKTSIWSSIACQIWLSECMKITRREWKRKGRKRKHQQMKILQWIKGLEETLLSLHLHHRVLSSSSSDHSHHSHHSNHKYSFKKPLLNLDVKFYLLMFNGDANPEKIDNWI